MRILQLFHLSVLPSIFFYLSVLLSISLFLSEVALKIYDPLVQEGRVIRILGVIVARPLSNAGGDYKHFSVSKVSYQGSL